MNNELKALVEEVHNSSKYKNIDLGLVKRIGMDELNKGRKYKEAVKATKNKLHQVGGAYLPKQRDPQQNALFLSLLEGSIHNPDTLKQTCRRIMEAHSSTRERLPILEQFYKQTLAGLPPINSVVDVACGLNPFAIPWMPLAVNAEYNAYDIYHDMIEFVRQGLKKAFRVRGAAKTQDVINHPPRKKVDLALVLKTIPCLEQVDKQAGAKLLDGLQAQYLLVSYPVKSLGGKDKGMLNNYQAHFARLLDGRGWDFQEFIFENELAYLVNTRT